MITTLKCIKDAYMDGHTDIAHRYATKGVEYQAEQEGNGDYKFRDDKRGMHYLTSTSAHSIEHFIIHELPRRKHISKEQSKPIMWAIADNHHGHARIIEMCNRPFTSVEDMDSAFIENWNSVVQHCDTTLVLGDFSFYNKQKTTAIVSALNGDKILILGNHDNHSSEWYRECGFKEVSKYPIVINDFWICSHAPMFINEGSCFGNIYGHVHDNEMYKDYTSHTFCVSAERINYTPVELSRIKEKCAEAGGIK